MTKANCRTALTRRIARLLDRDNTPAPIRLSNRLFVCPAVLKTLFHTRDVTERAPKRRAKKIKPKTKTRKLGAGAPSSPAPVKESNSCLK